MLGRTLSFWLYPNATGDPGRDRNARTLQSACLLFAVAIGIAVTLDVISREPVPTQMVSAVLGALCVASVLNRAGQPMWAGRIVTLALLLCAVLRVVHARDGFRSHAMLMFPGLLLLSVMLLDRASYLTTAGIVILTVTALGVAEKHGLFGAIPPVRTPTSYESIFLVDLTLLAFSVVGSRIVRDAHRNVGDLRFSISQLSTANIELRKTAEALRENEQQIVLIHNTVRDVIFHLAVESERQFRFVSVNAAFLNVTGLSEEAVVGKTVNEVIPEPSLTRVLDKYLQAIAERATVLWEETSDYPTGRLTGEVSVAPVFDDKGICTHLVGSVHDITARKQAEAALRESELRYKEVFDNFSECIFVLDVTAEGRFKFAGLNPAEEKATGLSSSEVAGKFIEEVFAEDVAKPLIAHYRSCLEAGTVIRYDDELNLPSGTRFFHTNLIPLRDGDGRIQRIVGCCMDFTELKRAQQEAFAMQKLESVGTLANGIAHDFNNLLGGVLAQAELASAELAAGLYPEEELKRIREVAIHGSEIVRQLMIYAGKETAVLELVDVSRIVGAMIELLRVSVSKHAPLETDLGKDLLAVRASAAQLRQIVMNLVTNASEAIGDRDGVIRVSTRCVTVGPDWSEVASGGLAQGDYLQLEVSDTGVGMPPEIQAKMFDPFFTTKSAGRGLGLAVVDGIVRNLGGAIHLKSEPDKGTTVQILLPCAKTRAEATDGPISGTEEAGPPSQQATVLVVEDEGALRQAVSKMLRRGGFSVIEASDGSAALETIQTHESPIDVLFLDLTLPGTPSREIFEEAKRLRPEMRVIVTSAYGKDTAEGTLGRRVERFMRKPFRITDLMDLVRQTLS